MFLSDAPIPNVTSVFLLILQIQGEKISAVQLTGEYRGSAATCSLTVANPDLVAESGLLVGSYLRRITPKLDLGADIIYQYGKQIPGKHFSVLQYAGRYTGADCLLW